MFKAMKGARFNKTNLPTLQDTIMVTEAEAASYFTARDITPTKWLEFLLVSIKLLLVPSKMLRHCR